MSRSPERGDFPLVQQQMTTLIKVAVTEETSYLVFNKMA